MQGKSKVVLWRSSVAIIGLLATLLLTGCGAGSVTSSATPPSATATAGDPSAYRLGPNDKVRVIVFGEDQLSGEYQVDSTGSVALPLVGEISAAGKSPREFEEAVRTAYANGYVRDPKISIEVLDFRPYYILGEVKKPGEYPYRTGLTVISAIAAAEGYTYRANTAAVLIDRPGQAGQLKVRATANEPIYPGDVITVNERFF